MATDNMEFASWLRDELYKRGLRQSDLARMAGIDPGYLSNVINAYKPASVGFCQGVARAFGIPVEEVYRRAGLMPAAPVRTERIARMLALFEELNEDDKLFIEQFTRLRVEFNRSKEIGRGTKPKAETTANRTTSPAVEWTRGQLFGGDRKPDAGAGDTQEPEPDADTDPANGSGSRAPYSGW